MNLEPEPEKIPARVCQFVAFTLCLPPKQYAQPWVTSVTLISYKICSFGDASRGGIHKGILARATSVAKVGHRVLVSDIESKGVGFLIQTVQMALN